MVRKAVKLANGLISIVTGLALLLAGVYAAYCLWDNQQVYAAADNVQAELLALKPKMEAGDEGGPTFGELLALNKDVCAWVTMDGTKIDHPVLQGESNMDYINTDVYGNFALAGSIFLDSRNDPGFTNPYSVLYGHHMDKGAMFGDLDKYLEKAFFEENQTGVLLAPGKSFALQVFACIQTKASEDRIFDPMMWEEDVLGLLDFAEHKGIHYHAEQIDALRAQAEADRPVQVLALTTCSSDFTDARTIVLAAMESNLQGRGGDTQP